MGESQYSIDPLTKMHDRKSFDCGNAGLDTYLKEGARQDANRDVATVLYQVAINRDIIYNYLTISGGVIIMRKPIPIPENRLTELEAFRKKKWPGYELQRFMCVWLRIKQAMPTSEIAKLIEWHINTVRIIQRDFIKRGVTAITESKRGGRHHALLTPEEEKELLAPFEKMAERGALLVANEIKEALEKRVGNKVHKTTVYRILHRNGWRKVVPRPSHPKCNKVAGEAFKKGALRTV